MCGSKACNVRKLLAISSDPFDHGRLPRSDILSSGTNVEPYRKAFPHLDWV